MEVSTKEILKIAGISGIISVIFFLMIEVFLAQVLLDIIIPFYESGNFLIILITLIGFFISLFVSLVTGYFATDQQIEKKFVTGASILSFLSNFLLWVAISYISIISFYPEILDGLTTLESLIAFPSIIGYFSIYVLDNVTFLWLYSQITYSIFFPIFLKALGSKKVNYLKHGYER